MSDLNDFLSNLKSFLGSKFSSYELSFPAAFEADECPFCSHSNARHGTASELEELVNAGKVHAGCISTYGSIAHFFIISDEELSFYEALVRNAELLDRWEMFQGADFKYRLQLQWQRLNALVVENRTSPFVEHSEEALSSLINLIDEEIPSEDSFFYTLSWDALVYSLDEISHEILDICSKHLPPSEAQEVFTKLIDEATYFDHPSQASSCCLTLAQGILEKDKAEAFSREMERWFERTIKTILLSEVPGLLCLSDGEFPSSTMYIEAIARYAKPYPGPGSFLVGEVPGPVQRWATLTQAGNITPLYQDVDPATLETALRLWTPEVPGAYEEFSTALAAARSL